MEQTIYTLTSYSLDGADEVLEIMPGNLYQYLLAIEQYGRFEEIGILGSQFRKNGQNITPAQFRLEMVMYSRERRLAGDNF